MHDDSRGTEVFPSVDPDPEAVLDAEGIDSVAALAGGDGAHDPTTDDAIDADETTAAELFADLETAATTASSDAFDDAEPTADVSAADDLPAPEELDFEFVTDTDVVQGDGDAVDSHADDLSAVTDEVPSDVEAAPAVSAPRPDSKATDGSGEFEATPASEMARTGPCIVDDLAGTEPTDGVRSGDDDSRDRLTIRPPADDLEIVGPAPTLTRISDDAFGRVDSSVR